MPRPVIGCAASAALCIALIQAMDRCAIPRAPFFEPCRNSSAETLRRCVPEPDRLDAIAVLREFRLAVECIGTERPRWFAPPGPFQFNQSAMVASARRNALRDAMMVFGPSFAAGIFFFLMK